MTSFLVLVLFGCDSTELPTKSNTITADLYYSWWSFGSFYGQPDSVLTKYNDMKNRLGYEGMMKEDSTGTLYLKMLEENNLLTTPFIYLLKDNDQAFILFMDNKDYSQFTNFEYQELINNKQKVSVVAEVDHLREKIYVCKNLISVNVVEGQTLQKQGIFKIYEYQ